VKNKPVYPKGFTLVMPRLWWCHATVWHSKHVIIFPTVGYCGAVRNDNRSI